MTQYFSYFVEGSEQFVLLATIATLWVGLAALGGLATGRRHVMEAAPIYGWGVISLVFVPFGTLTAIPFSFLAWGLFGLAAIGALYVYRRDGALFAPGTIKMAALVLPLLLIASTMMASQWDEFSHWLPAPRFLLQTDAFPSAANPVTGTQMLPAYPYNWPLLTYLASKLAGDFQEGAGRILNVALLMSFGLIAARLALHGAGRSFPGTVSWPLAGLALMAGTLLNPSFVQKVVLTAYADTSTAVIVAFGAYIGWKLLDALVESDDAGARSLAWQFALSMVVLINIKQVNLVLLVSLLAGICLAGLRDPLIRNGRLIGLLAAAAAPALILYLVWRLYVGTAMASFPGGGEAVFMPLDQWNIGIIPQILGQMLVVAGKKIGHFGPAFLAVGFAVHGLIRFRGSFDRLAIIVASGFLGYNAFMLLVYVGSFSEYDALRVVSYWRYNMHVALLSVLFGAFGAGWLWRRFLGDGPVDRRLAFVPVALVLVAPLIFAPKLRFDLHEDKPQFNGVAFDLAHMLEPEVPLHMLDPQGSGEAAVIARYRMNRLEIPRVTGFHKRDLAAIQRFLDKVESDGQVLVQSVSEPVEQGLGLDLEPGHVYLTGRDGEGWKILHHWSPPFR